MYRLATTVMLGSAFALAACGGGGGSGKQASPAPSGKQTPNGGVGTAEPSKGRLGPATTVDPQGAKTIGKPGPISPKENRPTDAQTHGVAGGVACTSTSADPAPSNLGSLNAAILCLLNAERASKGM